MKKKGVFIIVVFLAALAHANEMMNAQVLGEEMGLNWGKTSGEEAQSYVQALSQQNPFTAPNEKNLSEQGVVEFYHDDLGKYVHQQKVNNPDWVISDKDRLQARAQGELDCALTYTSASCLETPTVREGCIEVLDVETVPSVAELFTLEIYASSYAEKRTTFYFDLTNGSLTEQEDAKSTHGWSTPSLAGYDCRYLTFTYLGWSFYDDPNLEGEYQMNDVVVEAPTMPSCGNRLTLSLKLSQTHHKKYKWKKRGVKHTYQVTYQRPAQYRDRWSTTCLETSMPASCMPQDSCLEGPSTKLIDGVEVHRDCWKRQRVYSCSTPSAACETLREKGCEQISTSCQQKNENGLCRQFVHEFRCPESSCETKKEEIQVYCQDGDCFKPKAESLGEFDKAMSHLSTAVAAGQGAQLNEIFKGQAMTCRKMGMDFNDCCQDKGWGKELHLMECKEEEKLLGMAKEGGRVIEVGDYCDKKVVGGGCLERKKSYCVYPSKLARIIQNDAIKQLNRSLGEVKNPICAPLSPDDLQTLDWDKIDFSPLYEDIQSKTKPLNVDDFKQKMLVSLRKNENFP